MDIEKLLQLFNTKKVQYVIIGATAFPVHGYARATLDIDFFIENSLENVQRVYEALKEFGYDMSDVSMDDLQNKKLLIRQYILETDIHPFVKGATFEEVWANKITNKIGDVEVYFASLNDLIKMKKAAARPKDLEDLKALEKLQS